jgi:RHS repeat-associated protein
MGDEDNCGRRIDDSIWKVWDLAGNEYKFNERMQYINHAASIHTCRTVQENSKWLLTSIRNTGGQEIDFKYTKTQVTRDPYGLPWYGEDPIIRDDVQVQLHEIYYAQNHYYVHFTTEARGDYEDSCFQSSGTCLADNQRLKSIEIYYNPSTSQGDGTNPPANSALVRKYGFNYVGDSETNGNGLFPGLYPGMYWLRNNVKYYTATLHSIQEFGKDSQSQPENHALPATLFTYSDGMHLTDVENGYNGKVHFSYEATPWPSAGVVPLDSAYNIVSYWGSGAGIPIGPGGGFSIPTSVAPGKNLFVMMDVSGDYGNDWCYSSVAYKNSAGSQYSISGPTLDLPLGASVSEAFYIGPVPANATGREADSSVNFLCGGSTADAHHLQYAQVVTRYRVTQKTIYPNAGDASSAYSYTYDYHDENGHDTAAVNTSSLTTLNPTSDYAFGKVLHTPFSEFRGHGVVKVTNPDGSYSITHYYQTDTLAGQMKDSTLYKANGQKISATVIGTRDANGQIVQGSDYNVVTISPVITGNNAVVLPKCGSTDCKDARIYWTSPKLVEKRTYNVTDSTQYLATRTEYAYLMDAGLPLYGLVKSVTTSEKNGSAWTVQTKQYSTYDLGANFINANQYIAGLTTTRIQCDANGDDSNSANLPDKVCGTIQGSYLKAEKFEYESGTGRLAVGYTMLGFTTSAVTNDGSNRNFAVQQYGYDAYGNVNRVQEGYRNAGDPANTLPKSTTSCYGSYSSTPVDPSCVDDTLGAYLGWEKNALNQVTRYSNDPVLGAPTSQTDSNGAVTSVEYDEFGRLKKVAKPGDSLADPTYQFTYHDSPTMTFPYWTEAIPKIDAGQSYVIRKFYNGLGELIQTQQVGAILEDNACSSDADSDPDVCTIVVDQKTEYASGVKHSLQTAPYAIASPGYAAPTWQNATETTYDELDRTTRIKSPDQLTDEVSQRFSYTLDGDWMKVTATDPKGNSSESWKDAWDQVRKVKPATGPMTQYSYDKVGRMTSVEQKNRADGVTFASTTLSYDMIGRKTVMTDPDMGTWQYGYDYSGNLVTQNDARGQRTCLYYDALNRLKGKNYPALGSACPPGDPQTYTVGYTYDDTANGNLGKGRRTGMHSPSDDTAWKFDARGRVLQETKTVKDGTTTVGTYVTAWTYTSADQVKTMTYPTTEVVTYSYLPQGQANSLASAYNLNYLSSLTVDPAGRLKTLVLGNNTQTSYGYNAWTVQGGRLQAIQSGNLTGLQNLAYSYDLDGNITSISDGNNSGQKQCFSYDALNRLTRATTKNDASNGCSNTTDLGVGNYDEAYSYDAITGNLSSKTGVGTYGYDPAHPHAVTKLDNVQKYVYDANGSMTSRTVAGVAFTLGYDEENHLTSLSGGGLSVIYRYDADGNRVLVKQANGDQTVYVGNYFEAFIDVDYVLPTPTQPNCGAGYHCNYLPLVLTPPLNPPATTGQIWRSYYSAGSSRITMRVQDNAGGTTGGVFWLYSDHLGSTSVAANVFGNLTSPATYYTAWGETRSSSGSLPTQHKFTGQIEDSYINLYWYGSRWYDPALGRFLSPDSIVPDPYNPLSYDRFSYVRNNSVNRVDPSGHADAVPVNAGCSDENCRQQANSIAIFVFASRHSNQSQNFLPLNNRTPVLKSAPSYTPTPHSVIVPGLTPTPKPTPATPIPTWTPKEIEQAGKIYTVTTDIADGMNIIHVPSVPGFMIDVYSQYYQDQNTGYSSERKAVRALAVAVEGQAISAAAIWLSGIGATVTLEAPPLAIAVGVTLYVSVNKNFSEVANRFNDFTLFPIINSITP